MKPSSLQVNIHPAPLVMGVLNVTPDSFSDGGAFYHPEQAMKRAMAMYEEGATVIDVGGESSRPGAHPISVHEELDRVMPVLEKIKQEIPVRLSIDTVKPEVMAEAVRLGVWMVNDIHALQSPGALSVMAEASCQICLMHKQGDPLTMQQNPQYSENVVADVSDFFERRIQAVTQAGIKRNRLWLDPGVGFGKQVVHNLTLLKHISAFLSLDLPLMVGISRKSILAQIVNQPVEARQAAGLAGAVYLMLQGVKMIRTHDVRATQDALLFLQAILGC